MNNMEAIMSDVDAFDETDLNIMTRARSAMSAWLDSQQCGYDTDYETLFVDLVADLIYCAAALRVDLGLLSERIDMHVSEEIRTAVRLSDVMPQDAAGNPLDYVDAQIARIAAVIAMKALG